MNSIINSTKTRKINYNKRALTKLGREKVKIYLSNMNEIDKEKELQRIDKEIQIWINAEVQEILKGL
jgi:hypothetical protein